MTTHDLSYIPKLAAGLLQYEQNGLHLMLDPEKPAWAVVNPTGMEIASLYDGKRDIESIASLLAEKYQLSTDRSRQDVLAYTHNLANAGLLRSEADISQRECRVPDLKGVYLHVTNRCNLNCKHCYTAGMVADNALSPETIFGLVDQLAGLGNGSITISGGEPLLREDIKEILAYASEKLDTILLTNGTLVDHEMAEFLSNLDIDVQISLDGISPVVHENIRGEGTFDKTMRAIQLLLERNMKERLALSIAIMKSNMSEVPKLFDFALESGISRINMVPVVNQGNASLNWEQIRPDPHEYQWLFEQIYPVLFEHREKITVRGCLVDFIFGTLTNPRETGCPAGERLMVNSNGDVYPCSMISHPDYLLGNVRNQGLDEIHRSHKIKQMHQQFAHRGEHIDKCRVCEWQGFCRGACPGTPLWQKGTIWDTDDLCQVRAELYRKLIFEYAGSRYEAS